MYHYLIQIIHHFSAITEILENLQLESQLRNQRIFSIYMEA